MSKFESLEGNAPVKSSATTLFDDAYNLLNRNSDRTEQVAGVAAGVLAVGIFAATRGKSGMSTLREALAVSEGTVVQGGKQVAEEALSRPVMNSISHAGAEAALTKPVVQSVGQVGTEAGLGSGRTLQTSLVRFTDDVRPDVSKDMLKQGLALADRPQYFHKVDLGLPLKMDAETGNRLHASLVSRDRASAAAVLDDLFGAPSTYTQMRRQFGG